MLLEVEQKGMVLQDQLIAIEVENKRESDFYNLQKKSEESTTERRAIETYFLSQSSASIDFLNQIEQLAPRAGVDLVTESLKEASDKKTKQKWVEAEFSFSGSRKNVDQFIEVLETVPFRSQVTAVSLSSQANVWDAKVSMRVDILNYEI
jgi:UDP-glucose 6-dehydrogenase